MTEEETDLRVLELISKLKFGDEAERARAAKELGEIGEKAAAAVPDLIKGLRDGDYDVREAAVAALGKIGEPAVAPLIASLKGDNVDPAKKAADALAEISDIRALPVLLAALEDEDYYVRWGAAAALGKIGDVRAIPALIGMLKDVSIDVNKVVKALGKIGAPAAPALIELLQDPNNVRNASKGLREIGALAIPALIEAFKDENADVCLHARSIFKHMCVTDQISDSRFVSALVVALKDNDETVRYSAAEALGKIRDVGAVPVLIEALKDAHATVRQLAARALGEISDTSAVPALLEMLNDAEASVRLQAAEALGKLGDDKVIPLLFAAAMKHPELREKVQESANEIAKRSQRPSGVKSTDERPTDLKRVGMGMALDTKAKVTK